MNNLQHSATSQHTPNPLPILGIRNLVRYTNAVVCTSNIKKSLANIKSPLNHLIEEQSVESHNIKNKKT